MRPQEPEGIDPIGLGHVRWHQHQQPGAGADAAARGADDGGDDDDDDDDGDDEAMAIAMAEARSSDDVSCKGSCSFEPLRGTVKWRSRWPRGARDQYLGARARIYDAALSRTRMELPPFLPSPLPSHHRHATERGARSYESRG